MGMPQCNIVLTIPVKTLCAYDANIMTELKKQTKKNPHHHQQKTSNQTKRPNIILTIPAKILCACDGYIMIELKKKPNNKTTKTYSE